MQMRNLLFAGILTWVIVALPHVRNIEPMWAVCYVAFLVLFLITRRAQCPGAVEMALLLAQVVMALTCVVLQPYGMQSVLLVMVAAQLGHLRTPYALTWIVTQSLALYVVVPEPTEKAIWTTLGYFAFQLFGFLTARIAHDEREAKQALAEVNAELRVATGLLDMSSRAEERLRIARDLHDLIGHHLTALSLNLEVASHLVEGQAKEQVEKSKAITKLLLSDVRDVVSRLRADEAVDLGAALESLRDAVPSPSIHIDADGGAIAEPFVAQTALRAVQEIVTNAVRHGNARNLWLKIGTGGGALTVDARDDGSGTDRVVFGNGLRGMRERVQQAGGTLDVASMRGRGFEVHVRLPLAQTAAGVA
ncbi:MAG TPA: sensor histidine kinase [Gemmatimonadaceae bacterium]|nr:sensor histidine kinase [Gemmatimonadaceae bacterium]